MEAWNMAAQSWTLKGVFKCMLKALRVLRPNGEACFAAPVSGPARGKATRRNCSHNLQKQPRYQKKTRHEIKLDNEMNEKKKHGVYPSIPVPRPQEDPLTLWTTSPLVFSETHRLCRSNSASVILVILQGSICPPRQFNHPWKPGYLLWIKSQTLSGIYSLLSTRFKKHSSTDTFDLTYKAKGHKPLQVTPLLSETGWRTARAAYPTHNIYRVKMEDPDEKTSVRSVNSSSQREENPTCSTKNRMRCDWRDMACLIVGKKYSANFERITAQEWAASFANLLPSALQA